MDLVKIGDAHVNSHNTPNHLRHNDHIPQMRLDGRGLFVGRRLLLGLAELLDQSEGLALETALESAAGAGVDELKVIDVNMDISIHRVTDKK